MSYDGQLAEVEELWFKDDCNAAMLPIVALEWQVLHVNCIKKWSDSMESQAQPPMCPLQKPNMTWAKLGRGGGRIPDPHDPEGQYFNI